VSFERFAVVRVPFPFSGRNATRNRPALVLSGAVIVRGGLTRLREGSG
jgi:hypothetical protein